MKSFAGCKLYGVNPTKSSGNSERLAVLHDIAHYFTTDAVQEARYEFNSQVPSSTKVAALDKIASNAAIAAFNAQSADGLAQAHLPSGIWSGGEPLVKAIKADEFNGTDDEYTTILTTYNNTITQTK